LHTLIQSAARGEDQNGHAPASIPPGSENVQAISAGQGKIQHHGVIILRQAPVPAMRAVNEPVNAKPLFCQAGLDAVSDNAVVFNKQDAHGCPLFHFQIKIASCNFDLSAAARARPRLASRYASPYVNSGEVEMFYASICSIFVPQSGQYLNLVIAEECAEGCLHFCLSSHLPVRMPATNATAV
jgi:hypothetical protein